LTVVAKRTLENSLKFFTAKLRCSNQDSLANGTHENYDVWFQRITLPSHPRNKRIDKVKAIQQLVECINSVEKHEAEFFASGQIDLVTGKDAIEIEGIGPLNLPMRPKDVRELIAKADAAPYGKGTQTIVDVSVRDSLEISASCLSFSNDWKNAIEQTAREAAEKLGLPPDRIKAKPYKLLIYPKGGFFLPHRDSEKSKAMVASLIVMLPSRFGGGDLLVEHEGKLQRFDFPQARRQEASDFAAFYADCLHEVRKVTSGVRVCLSYNLSLKAKRKSTGQPKSTAKVDSISPLVSAIENWTQTRPATPLVFAMEHQYTASGLKPDLLKGKDRTMAKHLIAAAEKANCCLHLGQVERHLIEHATEGYSGYDGYRRGRYRHHDGSAEVTDPSDLDILEVIDECVTVDGWRSTTGKKVPLEPLSVDGDSIVSQTPIEQWKPTSFDYEGYTGNAGNTLDRWYHKSAIAIWAQSDHFDVLVDMGMKSSIAQFLNLQDKFASRKKPNPEIHNQQVQFARAIINAWPNRLYLFDRVDIERQIHLEKFAKALPQLNDLKLLDEFLQQIAVRDWSLPLVDLIQISAKQFAIDELSDVISSYLDTVPEPNEYGRTMASGLPLRDAKWLLKVSTLKSRAGFSNEQLQRFSQQMIRRLDRKIDELVRANYPQPRHIAEALPTLMKAMVAAVDETGFARCLDLRMNAGELLTVREFDVTVCCELIAWSDKNRAGRLPALSDWLQKVRGFLHRATESAPKRPASFTRPAEVSCKCKECQQLAIFLAEDQEHGSIKALKHNCKHLQQQIAVDNLDVDATIDRATRPFTLRMKKTINSFLRSREQYKEDLNRLKSLPE
jgi:predicted 2-oxoglutarate/Fe(II)-dependent dioxygenase YbiX